MRSRFYALTLPTLTLCALPRAALAWGLVVPGGSTDPAACIQVVRQTVEVEVDGSAGQSRSVMTFQISEGGPADILVPVLDFDSVETDAALHRASLDGRALELTTLETGPALAHLVDLASRRPTPALLALGGSPLAVARVDLAAGQHVLEVSGTPIVDRSGPTPRIVEPLRHLGTACYTSSVEVVMNVRDPLPIGAVFTPYHDRELNRLSPESIQIAVRTPAGEQCHDLVVYLATSENAIAAHALTYREPSCGDDEAQGYLLLAAGVARAPLAQVVPKDLALVIDTSGSMAGEKISQVREAVNSILEALDPADRFSLITFSSEARSAFGGLAEASDTAHVAQAHEIARGLTADGSTNISDALLLAARELGGSAPGRPRLVLFLTDGQPTAGITDPIAIVDAFRRANEVGARVFAFGVGDDVNTRLIDEIARQTSGSAHYIRPGSDIQTVLSTFYREVQAPVATDVELVAVGTSVHDAYPKSLPDIFVGSEIFAAARYTDAERASLLLAAHSAERETSIPVSGSIARRNTSHEWLPRLWASRRLGELLYLARDNGGDDATVAEIRALALRFGFVTRFTPFLVTNGEVEMSYDNPTGQEVGSEAVTTSGYTNDLSANSNAGGYSSREGQAPIVQVHDRTFILEHGLWIDTRVRDRLEGDADVVDVVFGGSGWQAMAAASPKLRELLSVGRSVAFEWHCQLVRVLDPPDHEIAHEDPLPPTFLLPAEGEDAAPLKAPNRPVPNDSPRDSQPSRKIEEAASSCSAVHDPTWFFLLGLLTLARRPRSKP